MDNFCKISSCLVRTKENLNQIAWLYFRNYFRCTHKYHQDCTPTKQIQKSEDDPSVFVITYTGQHCCRDPNIVTNLIVASNSAEPSIISFGSNTSNVTQELTLPSSPLFPKRQECDEEVLSSLTPSTPSSEIFDSPSLCKGPTLGPVAMEPASQPGDESSGLHSSTSSLDMRFMVDSLGCWDDLLCFDHGDFFRDWPQNLGMNFIWGRERYVIYMCLVFIWMLEALIVLVFEGYLETVIKRLLYSVCRLLSYLYQFCIFISGILRYLHIINWIFFYGVMNEVLL